MDKIEYIKLYWEHEPDEDPVIIFYEVNVEDDRLALRSIDIFADRSTQNIDNLYEGVIEIVSIPTVEEFNFHVWGEEFYAVLASKEEFDEIWNAQFYHGNLNADNLKGKLKQSKRTF